ncbi:MAG: glycosyltransferase [bacterium]|nr:glycosyltransferase [bacterium]
MIAQCMRVALLNSNYVKISKHTKKGTEILSYILIKELKRYANRYHLDLTAYASGNSKLPVKIESISFQNAVNNKYLSLEQKKLLEIALIAKAFSQHDNFDLYHVNIGNGESTLPFAGFVKKPILITMHGDLGQSDKKYFSLYKNIPNVYFISISNYQRKPIPSLNYVKTIYHGIDIKNDFKFNSIGGEEIMWAGRAAPEKGLDIVLDISQKTAKQAKIFPIVKDEFLEWLNNALTKKRGLIKHQIKMEIIFNLNRFQLREHYQTSRLFLFPIKWEEPFGFVMAESLACGTPVVAYARGSAPEIVKDGITGFLVNSSPTDVRGDFIIKKTGVEGLCEAVEKIYAMSPEEYMNMRKACRTDAENRFSVDRMVKEYIELYYQITGQKMPQDSA